MVFLNNGLSWNVDSLILRRRSYLYFCAYFFNDLIGDELLDFTDHFFYFLSADLYLDGYLSNDLNVLCLFDNIPLDSLLSHWHIHCYFFVVD